jgi:filamentous hemagglutinin family protein
MKLRLLLTILSTGAFSFCLTGMANPTGGVIIAGSGTIGSATGNALNINLSSSHSIIDWNSFSIAAGESTSYHFTGSAGAHSAVLNEVTGGSPSQLSGLLQSFVGASGATRGGSVYLVNPNGIFIGSSGQVKAGSFVASTLPLVDDSAFMSGGKLTLSGASMAGIQNEGSILVDHNVFLIAHNVENSGTISGHTAGLAAANEVTLAEAGNKLSVIAGSGSGTSIGVNNTASGQINAVVAQLEAANGNIYALAINNAGLVRATGVAHENGHVYLRANGGAIENSGTISADNASASGGTVAIDAGRNGTTSSSVINSGLISATGEKGGKVQVTGDQITLASGSTIDVSGQNGGGTAYIGGGPHGADPSIPDAQQTTVSTGASIDADAVNNGNGGDVVVWSANTAFAGNISARGGANGGNGGSVEVSGHQLAFSGLVDTLAPHGKAGNLLLDPNDLTIDNTTDTGALSDPTSTVTWDTIINNLNSGNVTLSTVGSSGAGPLNGAITVVDSPANDTTPGTTLNAGTSLTLQAAGPVFVNADIGAFPGGNLLGNLTLQSGLAGLAGSMDMQINNPMSVQGTLTLASYGNISIGANLAASSVVAQSGAGGAAVGAGNISWSATGLTVQADSQSYQAGNGGTTSSYADVSGSQGGFAPQFNNTANNAPPTSFTYRQDASIADADIPAISQFWDSETPVNYNIRSDGGDLTLSTGANVAQSALSLAAPNGTVNIDADLTGANGLASLSASGSAINLNTPGVTTSGTQTYNGAVTLGAATTALTSTGTGADGQVTFSSTVDGTTAGTQSLTVDSLTATFDDKIGGAVPLLDLTAQNTGGGTGTTVLGDSGIDASMAVNATTQNYRDAITLGANTTLAGNNAAATSVTFGSTVDGAENLTVNAAAAVFDDQVGSSAALNNLTTEDTDGIGSTMLGDRRVNTSMAVNATTQSYEDAVTLGANTTLAGNNTAATSVTFASTVDGARTLTVNAATATFDDQVGSGTALTGLTTEDTAGGGSTVLGHTPTDASMAVIATTQNYQDAVTLGANTMIAGNGAPATSVTFGGTVDGAASLGVDAQTVAFDDKVGNSTPLTSLTTGDSAGIGSTILGHAATDAAMSINASVQSYGDAVTLGANTTAAGNGTAATSVTFDSTVDATMAGAQTLTVNAVTASFDNVVGATAALGGLATKDTAGAGTTILSASVNAIDAVTQSYQDALTLGINTTFAGNGGAAASVIFGGTVDGTTAGSQSLTVNAASAVFDDKVGNAVPLASLTTENSGGSGTTTLGLAATDPAMAVNAVMQQYDAVTLGANTTVTGNGTAATSVTFGSTVDGAKSLTVNAATATFDDKVGNTTPLASLTTEDSAGSGTTVLGHTATDATMVVNAITQQYQDAVTVGAAATLGGNNTAATSVIFDNTVDGTTAGGQSLTVNAVTATFDDLIGGITPLGGLTTKDTAGTGSTILSSATTQVNAVTQNYGDAVTLGADTTFTGNGAAATSVTFGGTVDGTTANFQTLTVNAATAVFDDKVGSLASLASLTSEDAAGTTTLGHTATDASMAVDADVQQYDGAVKIGANTTLAGNGAPATSVTFDSTVDGTTAGGQTLTVNAVTATFDNSIGSAFALGGLTTEDSAGAGSTVLGSATTIVNAVNQNYEDALTLGANTTFAGNSTAAAAVTFASTVDGAHTLTVNAATTTFDDTVGGGTPLTSVKTEDTAGTGTTVLGNSATDPSMSVTTSGTQTYDNITLGADTTVTSTGTGTAGNITFSGTVNGAQALVVNTAGVTVFNGLVGNTTHLTSLTTDAAGTSSSVGVQTAGATTFNDPTSLSGTYGDSILNVPQAVTLAGDTTLTTTAAMTFSSAINGAHALTVDGPVIFDTPVGAGTSLASLTLNNTADLEGGSVKTSGAQNYNGAITLGEDTTLNGSSVGLNSSVTGGFNLTVSGTATLGGTVNVASLTLNNAATLKGGSVITSGAQNYDGAVTLGADETLSGSAIDLNSTVNGAQTLTVNGPVTLGGAVGGSTELTGLTFNDTASLNGGSVITSGAQNYVGAISLGKNTTLTGSSVDLNSTVTGAFNLTVNGSATFGGDAQIAGLTLNNGGNFDGGNVTTTGIQTYNGAISLGADTVLSGSGVVLKSTVDGAHDLTISGAATVDGVIGGGIKLAGLTFDNAVNLNAGAVATTGAQTYNGAVSLGADQTFNGSAVILNSTIDGAHALTANGPITFNGAVGGGTELTSVNLNNGGNLNGGAITTSGTQTYGGTISLGADTVLKGSGVTVNSSVDGAHSLTIDGPATLNAALGAGTALTGLTVEGAASLNGGSVKTSGAQTYSGAISLGGDETLSGSSVAFDSTVNGAHNLTVNGTATLAGAVGGGTALSSLALNGAANLNGGSVTTTGTQTYDGAVLLGSDYTLSGSSVALNSTVNGAHNLTVNSANTTTFGGAVGGQTALASLTTGANDDTDISGGLIATSGSQTYNVPVTLGANTVLKGTTLTLGQFNGNGHNLTLDFSSSTRLNGAVSGVGALVFAAGNGLVSVDNILSAGSLVDGEPTMLNGFNGSAQVTTDSGSQAYNALVTLTAPTTTLKAASAITFMGSPLTLGSHPGSIVSAAAKAAQIILIQGGAQQTYFISGSIVNNNTIQLPAVNFPVSQLRQGLRVIANVKAEKSIEPAGFADTRCAEVYNAMAANGGVQNK